VPYSSRFCFFFLRVPIHEHFFCPVPRALTSVIISTLLIYSSQIQLSRNETLLLQHASKKKMPQFLSRQPLLSNLRANKLQIILPSTERKLRQGFLLQKSDFAATNLFSRPLSICKQICQHALTNLS